MAEAKDKFLWGYNNSKDQAPGPGVNEPSVFSGGDGLIMFEGEPLARRVEGSVDVSLEWDEVYFQGQYTVGALVLKSIKISGGIKQATADLNLVRRWMGMYGTGYTESGDEENISTIRDVRYIPHVDIIFILDKSMLPDLVKSYEAILLYNAQMNSFGLPIAAASTIFNDQKFTAMNLGFKTMANKLDAHMLNSGSDKFLGEKNDYRNYVAGRQGARDTNTLW